MEDPKVCNFTFKKQIEIEVTVEITLNKEQRDPSDFGIVVDEENFRDQDADEWEDRLQEEGEKIAKELADRLLNEVTNDWEKTMKNKKVESDKLKFMETCYVEECSIEPNVEDWKSV